MKLHEQYQKFIQGNTGTLKMIESALRSLSYIIPGRFTDSEFAAEVLYSSLNLLKLLNDSVAMHGKSNGTSLRESAWNSYISFLKRQSKAMNFLLTFLNITWIVEVPLEMLVQRILGFTSKMRLLVLLELAKVVVRMIVFVKSQFRPLLRNYIPDLPSETKSAMASSASSDEYGILLSEIELSGEKEDNGIKNYLKRNRIDAYTLVPEFSTTSLTTLMGRAGEVCHIVRPLVYVLLLSWGSNGSDAAGTNKRSSRLAWYAWLASVGLDVASEWPQVKDLLLATTRNTTGRTLLANKLPPIERDERQVRLLKILLNGLREPLYSTLTKPYLESVITTLSSWRLLCPIMETAKGYKSLSEKVIYYTLGS